MKFYDKVKVLLQAGKWWRGAATWRHEKCEEFGGPAGWDGGKWWDILLVCSKDENTLIKYKFKKKYKADDGQPGMRKDMYWANAENLFLPVPIWTIVKNEKWEVLFQFIKDWDSFLVVKWWRWWLWNIHFKTSIRQYPDFALLWEPWQSMEVNLELQLLWDLALIGTPSVGKSTIINTISNTKAKTADYPFTTIVPNIWVVKSWDFAFNVVDVPGLIEGASKWKGLWIEFLRHVLKAKIWAFVVDLSRYEIWIDETIQIYGEIISYIKDRFYKSNEFGKIIEDIKIDIKVEDNQIILEVVWYFGKEQYVILKKLIYFVFNKYDMIDDQEILQEYKKLFLQKLSKKLKITQDVLKQNISTVSCFTRFGIEDFVLNISKKIKDFDSKDILDFDRFKAEKMITHYIEDVTEREQDNLLEQWYINESEAKYLKVWEILDQDVCYYVYALPWGNDEAEFRFWETLGKKMILKDWEKKWIKRWDVIKIKSIYPWSDDRYIMWD